METLANKLSHHNNASQLLWSSASGNRDTSYLSIISHQRVTTLIKLPTSKVNWLHAENILHYNQRLQMKEIWGQNVNGLACGLTEHFIIFYSHNSWYELLY